MIPSRIKPEASEAPLKKYVFQTAWEQNNLDYTLKEGVPKYYLCANNARRL